MTLYDLLTEEDRNLIISYVNNVGDGSLNETSLPSFLSSWNEEKEALHPLFGNSLILSKEITYNLPEVEPKKLVNEVLNTFWHSFSRPLVAKACGFRLNDPDYFDYYNTIDALFTVKNIVNKIYNNSNLRKPLDIPTPQGNRIRISNGVKTMRVIGKLARAWGYEATYETFRVAISRCFNSEPQTATLCLSIHPLDYFTMSDNKSDWESCMSWMNDGEYKQGTLEMEASPYCIVAYLLDSKENLQWYDYTIHSNCYWNSKKWRQLLFVHPAFIVGNRNYPNEIPEVEEQAMSWLRELAQTANFSTYRAERVSLINNRNTADREDSKDISPSFFLSLGMNQMYNDLNKNWYYLAEDLTPYLESFSYIFTSAGYRLSVNLSGTAHCVCCGNPINDTPDPRYLTCENCIDGYYCSSCGDFISGDPDFTNADGQYFCAYCWENGDITECDICEEPYNNSDMEYYPIENENGRPLVDVNVCPHCTAHNRAFPYFGELSPSGVFSAINVSPDGHNILSWRDKDFTEEEIYE